MDYSAQSKLAGATQPESELDSIVNALNATLEALQHTNNSTATMADRLFGAQPEKELGPSTNPPRPAAKLGMIRSLLQDLQNEVGRTQRVHERLSSLG